MTKRRFSLLALWAAAVYLFLYFPIAVMTLHSFNASRYPQRWGGFTLRWYEAVMHNEEILGAFFNSLIVGLVSTIVAVALGTAAAVAMRGVGKGPLSDKKKLNAHDAMESLLMFTVILPDIVLGIALLLLFVFVRLTLGTWTIILAHITFTMVYVFLVVRVRLRRLDPALEEAARDLGASGWETFWKVTFPLLLPGVLAGALLAFTLSFEDFLITFFTAGAGSATLPLQIYSMMKFGLSPEINALSTLFLVLIVLATLATQKWRVERE